MGMPLTIINSGFSWILCRVRRWNLLLVDWQISIFKFGESTNFLRVMSAMAKLKQKYMSTRQEC